MKSRKDFDSEKEYQDYLRKAFAMAAMQGILSDVNTQLEIKNKDSRFTGKNFAVVVAMNAIEFADELLKQLDK